MTDLRLYRLTILLHPQISHAERGAVEQLVTSWVRDHQGDVRSLTVEEKRRLAYGIAHHAVVPNLHAVFTAPPDAVRELGDRLRLEQKVLRTRLWQSESPTGKRLKDVPVRKPDVGGAPEKKGAPPKEKAPFEKLDEKIEEILKEEVL